ncbi:PorV/PorQ family protein [Rhodohalobacter sp.]|uniref:PorV/PorQ family protein n=1 Tax=Rhodohalobacter sp. TaxID=1974210 RepID=UPI00356A3A96
MKKFLKRVSVIIILSIFVFRPGISQDTASGLDFLNIGPSAQILAMGEGSVAVPTGSSSIYSNPSLLSFEKRSGLQVNYSLWIANLNNQFAAFHTKRDRFTFGMGVYGTQSEDFQARDQPGQSTGTFSISYFSLSGAAAYQLGPFSVGITGQFLREEIFQLRANGYAFNFGTSARLYDDRVTAGFSVNNIGKMENLNETSSALPSLLKAGIAIQLVEFSTPGKNDLPILLSTFSEWARPLENNYTGDFTVENADNDYLTVGIDTEIADLIQLYSAYRFGPTERPYSLGMGLLMDPIKVNYSFIPFSTGYGTAHSFGVEYYFN